MIATNITPLRRPARLHVVEAPALRVEQDGNRILIDGAWVRTFVSESNAARSAQHLQLLADLGWPIELLAARDGIGPEAA